MKILGYFASSKEANDYAQFNEIENFTVQRLGGENADAPWALILPLQGKKQAE